VNTPLVSGGELGLEWKRIGNVRPPLDSLMTSQQVKESSSRDGRLSLLKESRGGQGETKRRIAIPFAENDFR